MILGPKKRGWDFLVTKAGLDMVSPAVNSGYHASFQHAGLSGLLNFPAFYQASLCIGSQTRSSRPFEGYAFSLPQIDLLT